MRSFVVPQGGPALRDQDDNLWSFLNKLLNGFPSPMESVWQPPAVAPVYVAPPSAPFRFATASGGVPSVFTGGNARLVKCLCRPGRQIATGGWGGTVRREPEAPAVDHQNGYARPLSPDLKE